MILNSILKRKILKKKKRKEQQARACLRSLKGAQHNGSTSKTRSPKRWAITGRRVACWAGERCSRTRLLRGGRSNGGITPTQKKAKVEKAEEVGIIDFFVGRKLNLILAHRPLLTHSRPPRASIHKTKGTTSPTEALRNAVVINHCHTTGWLEARPLSCFVTFPLGLLACLSGGSSRITCQHSTQSSLLPTSTAHTHRHAV